MKKPLKSLIQSIFLVLRSEAFILLTVLGNGFIGLCGYVFFQLERGHNPNVNRFIDGLWWAFSTATTTGYGDITPTTDAGKVLSIFLMLSGLALFSMFTALFAEAILSHERKRQS